MGQAQAATVTPTSHVATPFRLVTARRKCNIFARLEPLFCAAQAVQPAAAWRAAPITKRSPETAPCAAPLRQGTAPSTAHPPAAQFLSAKAMLVDGSAACRQQN